MSKDAEQKKHDEDAARFGSVETIHDLEPEQGVGQHNAAEQRDSLLKKNDTVGYFEIEGGSNRGLGAPLHLGEEIKKDGGPAITQYEASYNQYAQPLRKTYRAMGRVRDLSFAGAALTPAQLQKNPKLAARFQDIKLKDPAQQPLDDWSESQSNMVTNIQRFGAGQHLLAAAVASYSKVQKGLEAKRKEAERQSKLAEIKEIDEHVKTIHEIMNVSAEAWSFATEIDEIIGSQAFSEEKEAEPPAEASEKPNAMYDSPHSTAGDMAGERTKVPGKGSETAGKAGAVLSGAKDSKSVIMDLKAKLKAAKGPNAPPATFDLSIDGMLTAVMGGKHYLDLKNEVAALDRKIRKLHLDQEADEMTSATEALSGASISFRAEKQQLKNDRVASRNHARAFAAAAGSGDEGIMAMYAAEAYSELAAFGELANTQRNDLMPLWGQAKYYMRTTNIQRFQLKNMVGDARHLTENLTEVIEQRDYFNRHLPEWKRTAQQWNDFFAEHAHHDLVRQDNLADKKEGG